MARRAGRLPAEIVVYVGTLGHSRVHDRGPHHMPDPEGVQQHTDGCWLSGEPKRDYDDEMEERPLYGCALPNLFSIGYLVARVSLEGPDDLPEFRRVTLRRRGITSTLRHRAYVQDGYGESWALCGDPLRHLTGYQRLAAAWLHKDGRRDIRKEFEPDSECWLVIAEQDETSDDPDRDAASRK